MHATRLLASCRRQAHSVAQGRGPVRPMLYTPLDATRSLLAIEGTDSTKFLQGLVSNDVRKLASAGGDQGTTKAPLIYAALLQADGRYMSDIFLHAHPSPIDPAVPSYLLEHPATQTAQIRSYLRRHVLRSKLKMGKQAESEYTVVQAWNNPLYRARDDVDPEARERAQAWLEQQRHVALDPRVFGMGWRFIAKTSQEGLATELPNELFELTTPDHYHLHRLSFSIPENPSDFPALPLEANLELMNGVDYKKGCYVGQELTARTFFKGVVRKRGVGIRLFREGEEVPDSLLPSTTAPLIPSPNQYPTPPPGSTLTPIAPTGDDGQEAKRASKRAPRPAGKLGSSLPLVDPTTGSTMTVAFGSVKVDSLDQVFTVTPPSSPAPAPRTATATASRDGSDEGVTDVVHERDEGAGEDGKWLAKGFMNEWVEFKLEEQEISKGT